jgi:hypothetical protein
VAGREIYLFLTHLRFYWRIKEQKLSAIDRIRCFDEIFQHRNILGEAFFNEFNKVNIAEFVVVMNLRWRNFENLNGVALISQLEYA